MPTTVLIDPDPGGHHFQAVANVAAVASQTSDVVFLTSTGARDLDAFTEFLADTVLETREVFDRAIPPTREIAAQLRAVCDELDVSTAVVMDADQSLKQWWLRLPQAFGLRRRPRIVFMLTRYPARLAWNDRIGWKLRSTKALLALAAMVTGSLHRVAGFSGRDDTAPGWLVKRTSDPDICTAHARDRAEIRAELDLPADRRIVGVFGVMNERRNAPLIWQAMQLRGIDADLVLGGAQTDTVRDWVASQPATEHGRIISFDAFLSNDRIDKLVAASDVAPIALTNNGPSGIMGKAIAAGVPIVTAGSTVRARELQAVGIGEVAELTAESIGDAIARILSVPAGTEWISRLPPATADDFARRVLGVEKT